MNKELTNTDVVKHARFVIAANMPAVDFATLLRYMKTNSGNAKEGLRRYPALSRAKPDIEEWIQEMWDGIEPFTAKEAFAEKDPTIRRVIFEHIGPTRLMNSIKKEKVDTFQHPKNPDQQYILWRAKAKELGITDESNLRENDYVFAVQMWCPSTNAEHWLWVNHNESYCQEGSYDAGAAIAWTCQPDTPVDNIEGIEFVVRQGESYTIKTKDPNISCERYPLNKEDYFRLITQET